MVLSFHFFKNLICLFYIMTDSLPYAPLICHFLDPQPTLPLFLLRNWQTSQGYQQSMAYQVAARLSHYV